MKRYEIIELLQKYYNLKRDDSFGMTYSSKDMLVRGNSNDQYATIHDRNSDFGVIITVDKNYVIFRVFIESGKRSYIAKIYNYDNKLDSMKKNITIDDISNSYSKFLVDNNPKSIINELERLFSSFKLWDSNIYTDSNMKTYFDLKNVTSKDYIPYFSVEDFAYSFVEKNNNTMIGVESINENIAILEYSASNGCSYSSEGKCSSWESVYHKNQIEKIKKYLESKNIRITVLERMYSHIMLLDLSNKDTNLEPYDEYNLWSNKK